MLDTVSTYQEMQVFWCNSGMTMLGVTSCFVIGLEVYSTGGDTYTSGTINLVKSLSMRDHHPEQNVLLLLSQMNIL